MAVYDRFVNRPMPAPGFVGSNLLYEVRCGGDVYLFEDLVGRDPENLLELAIYAFDFELQFTWADRKVSSPAQFMAVRDMLAGGKELGSYITDGERVEDLRDLFVLLHYAQDDL